MSTRISYKWLELKAAGRILKGRAKSTTVSANDQVKITRVIDPPLDFYWVEGETIQEGAVEISAHAVSNAVPLHGMPSIKASGGKARADAP